jgi:hypothetical protein
VAEEAGVRRRILFVGVLTALSLGGGVATADSADARRNLGGTVPQGAVCIKPGGVELQGAADANAVCICVSVPGGPTYKNVGRGGDCPPGTTR